MTVDASSVRVALASLRARIDQINRTWTHEVEITAVTKAFSPDVITAAVEAGCAAIGENYAQELLEKRPTLDALDVERRPRVDFIGRLQSNKVRQLAGIVDRWATVDRTSLANEIARRDPGGRVLVQVNTTGESHKGGCPVDDVSSLVAHCRALGLVVEGLLTVGPTEGEPVEAASGFVEVRRLVDELGLEVCSMGMTADVDVAVACGSTNVRIGSALFGARPPRARPVHLDGDHPG